MLSSYLSRFSIFSLLYFYIPFVIGQIHNVPNHHGRHRLNRLDLTRRMPGNVQLYKREFTNVRFTYYVDGLGACGQTNQPSDFIVAISHLNYGDGSEVCFKPIVIEYQGKQAQATIMDECMGCGENELDFSQGLFDYFADPSVGVIYGDWYYADDAPTTPTPTPTPTPTSIYVPPPPPPTSTYVPPPPPPPPPPPSPTSTYIPPPPPPTTTSTPLTTSTSTTPSPTSSSITPSPTPTTTHPSSTSPIFTTSVNLSAGPVGNIASVEGVVNDENGVVVNAKSNINSLNQIVINLGAFIATAARGENDN